MINGLPNGPFGAAADFAESIDVDQIRHKAAIIDMDAIEATGLALFGPAHWRAQMTAELGITRRTLQRWLKEPDKVPRAVLITLYRAMRTRHAAAMLACAIIVRADVRAEQRQPADGDAP